MLSAPVVRVGENVYPILQKLARVVGRLFPRLRLVPLGSGMLSRDEAVVEPAET